MRSNVLTFTLALALGSPTFAAVSQKDKDRNAERLTDAADLFKEIMGTPDKSIPQDLVEKAYCIVVVPGLKKAAFGIGALGNVRTETLRAFSAGDMQAILGKMA